MLDEVERVLSLCESDVRSEYSMMPASARLLASCVTRLRHSCAFLSLTRYLTDVNDNSEYPGMYVNMNECHVLGDARAR